MAYFDKARAQRAAAWFPHYLRLTKGAWAGKPFDLLPWQEQEVIRPIFGTLRDDGFRQYRTVYIHVPKKNGKSPLGAGIALRLLFADNEPGAEIYSAACDRNQASIVFDVAANMVRQNPKLSNRCKILDSTKRIIHHTGSFYRVLSAEYKSQHGFNPHAVIFDELHAQANRKLWDVLTVGAGAARRQPLTVALTTAGYDRQSICWEVHEYARKVKEGILADPSFLPVIYGADDDDDWMSEATWRKANPSMDAILNIEEMRAHCKKAQEQPSEENNFRRFRLNQWTRQETRYIPMSYWRGKCAEPFDPEILKGRPCYAGLDLASILDLTAFVMLFEIDGTKYCVPKFWIPKENIQQRADRDHVPYDLWVRQGYITATDGNTVDYDYIENEIEELGKQYLINEIAYDRWGSASIIPHLEMMGNTVVTFGQGWKSMSSPTKSLLRETMKGTLRHNGNPVMNWMADNLMVMTDAAGNVKPDKDKSTEKIDGITALIMALDRLLLHPEPAKVEIWGV